MKEIDFLPKWYKNNRQRQINYRTQYIALGCIFVVMLVWNLIATRSISKATVEITRMASKQAEAGSASQKLAEIKKQATQLQKKTDVLKEIDSKIDVAGVLAEMSFLIDEKIVLSKVDFKAERFLGMQRGKGTSSSTVRTARPKFGSKEASMLAGIGDVRFKVVMNGVAADAGDVAELVCKLEDSPYFCQVVPSFSRNKKMRTATNPSLRSRPGLAAQNYQVSEFEISCCLANYQREEQRLAKDAQRKNAERR